MKIAYLTIIISAFTSALFVSGAPNKSAVTQAEKIAVDSLFTSTGINLVDKNNPSERGKMLSSTGAMVPMAGYNVSNKIFFNGKRQVVVEKGVTGGKFGVNFYASDDTLLATVSQSEKVWSNKLFINKYEASYMLYSYAVADEDATQANYGALVMPYEPYQSKISDELLKDIITQEMEVVLPPKIYALKSKDIEIYYDNIIMKDSQATVSVVVNAAKQFKHFFKYKNDKASKDISFYINLYKNLLNIDNTLVKIDVVDYTPNNGKTLNVLTLGDSFTDIGHTQGHLKSLLEAKGVTVNQIGLMGKTDKRGEFLAGGTMESFVLSQCAESRILKVTGVTEYPETNFVASMYKMGDQTFVMTAVKDNFIEISPVYSDRKTGFTPEIPASGTITKSSGVGDDTISYTSYEKSFQNHFWNPSTLELDFDYYIKKWGFNKPDLMIIQFGYNDIPAWGSDAQVDKAVANAKSIIDRFKADYPNVQVIFSIQPSGAINSAETTDSRKGNVLNFVKKMVTQFVDNDSYNSFVYICPAYAFVDRVNAYGAGTAKPSFRFPNVTEIVPVDKVHPREGGMAQMADAQEPIVHKVLNDLP